MGRYDSSLTRVVPVFDFLLRADPTGSTWIHRLLSLASRKEVVDKLPKHQALVPNHGSRWGKREFALPAPQPLLEYLVLNILPKQVAASKDSPDVRDKRDALARRDPTVSKDALGRLRSGQRGRSWFVLEGPSKPDALLETDDLVVCIEGKRTERSCTTKTTWMSQRSQLLRHMDAAMERFPQKRIVGLLIVEGGSDALVPSAFWEAESRAQYTSLLDASLPHRSAAERAILASGVIGVVTWQTVCREFDIPWPPVKDDVHPPSIPPAPADL